MARKRGLGRWTEDQVWELGAGRLLSGVVPARSCLVERWCPRCSTGWRCSSNFASADEAEEAYWDCRDEILGLEQPTRRPWSWWEWEATSHCRCEPPCDVPSGSEARVGWLDRHDLLSPRERVLMARVDDA